MDEAIARIKSWKDSRSNIFANTESLLMENEESCIIGAFDSLYPETGQSMLSVIIFFLNVYVSHMMTN